MTQFKRTRCCLNQRILLFFFVFLIWQVPKAASKIVIRNKDVLNNYKFAALNGVFTSDCLDCKIEDWAIQINMILSSQSASKNNANQLDYCSIFIDHAPPKSEVLVFQNPQNAGQSIVATNDEIRYVSLKMPFEIQIFKGQLEKCESYSDAPSLQELIKRLNANLTPNQQQEFISQSYSNILLRTYTLDNPLNDVLRANFSNLEIIGDSLLFKPDAFSKEQAGQVFDVLIERLVEIAGDQFEAILSTVSKFHGDSQDKLGQIRQDMSRKIQEKTAPLREALLKADAGQMVKRLVRNSQEVISEFLSLEVFKKKRTVFLNGEVYELPSSYFADTQEVDLDPFIEAYVPRLLELFDEQVNLQVRLPPRLKMEVDKFVGDVAGVFAAELISAKTDLLEAGKIENEFKKQVQLFVSSEIAFKYLFSRVIRDEVRSRLGAYVRKWFDSELVLKLNLLNEQGKVKLSLLDEIYNLFGAKPFSKLPQKHHMIKFLQYEEDIRLI